MVKSIQGIEGGMGQNGPQKKEPPYASLFKAHGITPQEVTQHLQEKGLNSPKEVMEALKNGENPFTDLFAKKGISPEEVEAYEQQMGKPGQKGPKGPGKPKGPPPEVLAELQQYGLSPTGSLQGDLAAIDQAKLAQNNQQQGYNTNFLDPQIKQSFQNNHV
jgi:hypothetical protein